MKFWLEKKKISPYFILLKTSLMFVLLLGTVTNLMKDQMSQNNLKTHSSKGMFGKNRLHKLCPKISKPNLQCMRVTMRKISISKSRLHPSLR